MSVESFAVSISVDSMNAEKCLVFRQPSCSTGIAKYYLNLSECLDRAKRTSCVCFISFSGILAILSGFWALEEDFYQVFASLLHRFSGYKKKKKENKLSINPCFLKSA